MLFKIVNQLKCKTKNKSNLVHKCNKIGDSGSPFINLLLLLFTFKFVLNIPIRTGTIFHFKFPLIFKILINIFQHNSNSIHKKCPCSVTLSCVCFLFHNLFCYWPFVPYTNFKWTKNKKKENKVENHLFWSPRTTMTSVTWKKRHISFIFFFFFFILLRYLRF